ncbi:MAG: extracellular solute-binding protein [Azoarcus sp.]|jgi:sn-glycerol 3-phosphate transport system substrate-binding protein|nr:extracellular solute-binding protein [Azoarcus sp.]
MSTTIRNIGYRGLVCAVGVAVLTALAVPVAAAPAKAKSTASAVKKAKAPATDTERTPQVLQIELFQNLLPSRAKALRALVDRFNAQNKTYQVTLVDQDWRADEAPHMMILDGDEEEAFLAGKTPRYKPLFTLMRQAGVALQTVKPQAMVTRKPLNAKGQLLALPVGLNTPVLYFNRAALKRAGLDAASPGVFTTFSELQGTLGKLAASGSRCPLIIAEPARVLLENESAWNNMPVFKGKQAVFTGLFHVRYLSQMSSWNHANLLYVSKDRNEADQRFASGECSLLIAPSDSWVDFQKGGLDAGVTRLPYQDDTPGAPQNTLADGASLWAAAGKKAPEYKGVANFVAFWLLPENQVAWQREAGYLPLSKAGIMALDSQLLAHDLENIKVAVGQLTNRPVTSNSATQLRAPARRVVDEELADVWADRKSAKAALDSAAAKLSGK